MYSFGDFEQLGIDHPAKPSPPKAQDAACIMYTSGTTGTRRALVCSHQMIVYTLNNCVLCVSNLALHDLQCTLPRKDGQVCCRDESKHLGCVFQHFTICCSISSRPLCHHTSMQLAALHLLKYSVLLRASTSQKQLSSFCRQPQGCHVDPSHAGHCCRLTARLCGLGQHQDGPQRQLPVLPHLGPHL